MKSGGGGKRPSLLAEGLLFRQFNLAVNTQTLEDKKYTEGGQS